MRTVLCRYGGKYAEVEVPADVPVGGEWDYALRVEEAWYGAPQPPGLPRQNPFNNTESDERYKRGVLEGRIIGGERSYDSPLGYGE